jgi:hypothetical protein
MCGMPSRIIAVAVDCPSDPAQAKRLRDFWCEALDYRESRHWRDAEGTEYVEITGDGPMLLFQPVGEDKRTKNRLHLDIAPAEGDQPSEVARLVAFGAEVTSDDPVFPWVVLADPAGNEFCVLPPRSGG